MEGVRLIRAGAGFSPRSYCCGCGVGQGKVGEGRVGEVRVGEVRVGEGSLSPIRRARG